MNAYQFLLNPWPRADSTDVRELAENLERAWDAVIDAHLKAVAA